MALNDDIHKARVALETIAVNLATTNAAIAVTNSTLAAIGVDVKRLAEAIAPAVVGIEVDPGQPTSH